jgi:hypothetical protein
MLIISRLSILISSSLAQKHLNLNQICSPSDPCSELQNSVDHTMILMPLGIALIFLILKIPLILFKSKVNNIRDCIWVLSEIWIHLVITYFISDKAQAYAWSLQSSAFILTTWQPKKCLNLHKIYVIFGVGCIAFFAWQLGPPIGLAAWYNDAQCGWKVHLISLVGIDLLHFVLWPLEALVKDLN